MSSEKFIVEPRQIRVGDLIRLFAYDVHRYVWSLVIDKQFDRECYVHTDGNFLFFVVQPHRTIIVRPMGDVLLLRLS